MNHGTTGKKKAQRMAVSARRCRAKRLTRMGAAVLALLLAVGMMTGCTGTEKLSGIGAALKEKAGYSSGTNYLCENQIEITEVPCLRDGTPAPEGLPDAYEYSKLSDEEKAKWADYDCSFVGSYLEIDGLKNKEVEAMVNEKLYRLFLDHVGEIPSYRGIRAKLGEHPKRSISEYSLSRCTSRANFNYNNILSVSLDGYDQYESVLPKGNNEDSKESDWISVSYTETLNIDLRTGKEIPITGLYSSNGKAMDILNRYVREKLVASNADEEDAYYNYMEDVKLASNFTGLKKEQKYFLDLTYGIEVVLDADTPEFGLEYEDSWLIAIPFSSGVNFSKFFRENVNIYEKDAPWNKVLFRTDSEYDSCSRAVERSGNIGDKKNIYMSFEANVPKGSSKPLEELIVSKADISDAEALAKMDSFIKSSDVLRGFSVDTIEEGSIGGSAYADIIGHYVTVHVRDWCTADAGEYSDYDGQCRANLYRIEADGSLTELGVTDIIREGMDGERIVKDAIFKSAQKAFAAYAKDAPEEEKADCIDFGKGARSTKDKAFIDLMYDHITSLALQETSVTVIVDNEAELGMHKLAEEYYGEEAFFEHSGHLFYSLNALEFSDLGAENLIFFQTA